MPQKGMWRIIWYNTHPVTNTLERVRKTFNLNRITDLKQRKLVAQEACALINQMLRKGWNYFADGLPQEEEAEIEEVKTVPTLREALEEANKIKCQRRGHDSVRSYASLTNVFIAWAEEAGFAAKPVTDFKARDFQAFLNERIEQNMSVSNLNGHITHQKALFKLMCHPLEYITANPLEHFKHYPETESSRYEPLTKEELMRVATHLKQVNPRLFLFTQFVYYAYIRPGHLAGLQRKQINFEDGTITIYGSNTKAKRNTTKQLLQPLAASLLELGIDKLPPETYLFSKGLMPDTKKYTTITNRTAELWQKHIMEELKIPKYLYALKHTSGSLYITENEHVDIAWLQRQMEHSSLAETEAYVQKRAVKKIDESKMSLPDFTGTA